MTQRVRIPTNAEVEVALKELTEANDGRPVPAVALARQLGLANATFWRHFPQVAQELADTRRKARSGQPARSTSVDGGAPFAQGGKRSSDQAAARLRREKAQLEVHLEVAVAHIQRLTLENRALQHELEQATGVTRLASR